MESGFRPLKVELSLSCVNITSRIRNEPNVCVSVKIQNQSTGCFVDVGKTELIEKCSQPKFKKNITLDYKFEEKQCCLFEVYDLDTKNNVFSNDALIGTAKVALGEVISNKVFTAKVSEITNATVNIYVSEVGNANEVLFQVFGKNIVENAECNASLSFSKQAGTIWELVHETEVQRSTDPIWEPVKIRLEQLCCDNFDKTFLVECHNSLSSTETDLIGVCHTTINTLLKSRSLTLQLNEQAELKFENARIEKIFTFLDYILTYNYDDFQSGGCKLNFTFGIDFTSANRDFEELLSLHHCDRENGTRYTGIIEALVEIVQDYSAGSMIDCFGFGAKLPYKNDVNHIFPLNFCTENPGCSGVDGVLSAYHYAIDQVKFSGPSRFSPILKHMSMAAKEHEDDSSRYFVLVLLTASSMEDIDQTKDAVVRASYLPISILIIGVGDGDFSAIEALENEGADLKDKFGRTAFRNIIKFITLRNFSDVNYVPRLVLSHLPYEITSFYNRNDIPPLIDYTSV